MATFDLGRFRDLAFARPELPDHPLQGVDDAKKVLAEIAAGDPDKGLADITHWVAGMNATDSFSAGRRARILLTLDEAARPLWRLKSESYLLPDGPGGRRTEGDPNILRALFDSASEFAAGFEIVLNESANPDRSSRWVEQNHVLLHARNMRWLARRLALSHMLRLDAVGAIWERTHRLYHLAEEYEVARIPVQVFAGDRLKSSVRQEYTHMLLLELASPEGMRARDIELAFRIARTVAGSVRLEAARSTEAPFAVVPAGDARPGAAAGAAKSEPAPLYIATLGGLTRLRDMLERDKSSEDAAPDTLYGEAYSVGQRRALIKRLLEYWGADAPQRRSRRVPLASKARIVAGFERVVEVIPALDKSAVSPEEARRDLQLSIDDTTRTLSRAKLRAAQSIGSARVIDASNGGLGLAIARSDATWARLGAIVGIAIEPGNEWLVGVLRRMFAIGKELRLGIQVLAKAPRVLMLNAGSSLKDLTWEDAVKHEATYRERFRKAILLEAKLPLTSGDLLLPPKLAQAGGRFEVPLPGGLQTISVAKLLDDSEHYQRASFEAKKPS